MCRRTPPFGVEPGVEAVIRVPEMPDRDFPGKVTRIADALQPGTRTLLTEIDVPNPDGALPPGIYCTVELKIPRKSPSLIVPSEAIIFNRDGLSRRGGRERPARIRKVTVVRDFGTSVEVSEGVARRRQGHPEPAGRSGRRPQGDDPAGSAEAGPDEEVVGFRHAVSNVVMAGLVPAIHRRLGAFHGLNPVWGGCSPLALGLHRRTSHRLARARADRLGACAVGRGRCVVFL